MGDLLIREARDERDVRAFTRAVLRDLSALERLIDAGLIETGVRRIGAEQEMYLVGQDGRPAPCAPAILTQISDQRFTTELARFNIEANFPPHPLEGEVFGQLEEELRQAVDTANQAARALGSRVLLTGILPTLRREDLSAGSLTPEPRYRQLNDALLRFHGAFSVAIDGIEHYEGTYNSVAMEGANTSFQIHLQVAPHEGARLYNLAQLVSAPLLAAASNSPILLGRRLWHETRIAVFERSIDSRTESQLARGSLSRATFGDTWLRDSLVELFRDNLARFPVILTRDLAEDSMDQVEQGIVPALKALGLHNGTVWRWNRPCYGIGDGRPHLRIECRVLPAGPSVIDEVANAAFFFGMMLALPAEYGDVALRLPFADARANFLAAARLGLGAEFSWLDGRMIGARDLVLRELLPFARAGLEQVGVPTQHLDRYLGTLEARVRTGQTGSAWLLGVFNANRGQDPQTLWPDAVEAMFTGQNSGTPVHQWPTHLALHAVEREPTVGQFMTTDVFTVRPDDVIDLATSVMEWKHIRHIPVESDTGELIGILTTRELMKLHQRASQSRVLEPVSVEQVMRRDLIRVSPDLGLAAAMRTIVDADTGCLLVVDRGHLAGIVTDRDLVQAARRLLEQRSAAATDDRAPRPPE